ncbi:serine/threonine-protein kinase [Nocardiopsis sp. LOL_012]|uniref:serine/threonine-protein kinase n=1 Tax=Nocardiopsis sp. LOL_012 TaxID=3345409 RepID=UPI003A87416E
MPSDGLPKNLEPLAAGDPATIGPYVLSGKLGSGGMGTVYLGSAGGEKGHQVAIKVIRPELAFDEATRARFRDEMENARKVASFCTAKVLDHGTFENRPYMVTEYIAGTALAEHISENGPLDSSTLHGFALGVAAALAAIHRTGLVHRDLKPANVLLSLSGPRVIDFGIARAMNTATNHTQTGIVMGSPGWMAPEQLLEEQVTTAADIFAWGCLVAFAGNGTHPFGNGDAMTLGKRVLFAEPQIGRLDSPLDRLVSRALAKEPGRRPTAQDLLLELAGGQEAGNPNDMVSQALHQSWRPNLPPGPPGHPHAMHPATGVRQQPLRPGAYPAPHPTQHPAHQSGTFSRPQAPPPGRGAPAPSAPRQAAQGQPPHPVQAPAQHPASTGPIPIAQDPQAQRPGPQPYVPPVPPPPHRPAAPRRRKGLLLGAVAIGVAVLLALAAMLLFVSNIDFPPFGDDTDSGVEQEDTGTGTDGDGRERDEDKAEAADGINPDGSVTSADGMVTYTVKDVDCEPDPDSRSSVLSGGTYCIVRLSMDNDSDAPLSFRSQEQFILTSVSDELTAAETPTSAERQASLWNPEGIAPGSSVEGDLVFLIPQEAEPDSLQLTHLSGQDRTVVPIGAPT